MNNLELSIDLFSWLSDFSILTEDDIKDSNEEKIILKEDSAESFKIGLRMPPLLHRLQALKVSYL